MDCSRSFIAYFAKSELLWYGDWAVAVKVPNTPAASAKTVVCFITRRRTLLGKLDTTSEF
jgi:hypothetical protein